MKKVLIVIGALALLCGAVCGYLVLSHPHDHESSRMARVALERSSTMLEELSAKGLMPGDEEYDTLDQQVANNANNLSTMISLERESDDQNALFGTIAVASGATGLLLLGIGLVLRKKVATSTNFANALQPAGRFTP